MLLLILVVLFVAVFIDMVKKIYSGISNVIYAGEDPAQMTDWLKTRNLKNISNEAKQQLAKQLKAQGINGASPVEDVAKAFRRIANKELEAYGLQDNENSKEEVEAYANCMITAYYETRLKPYVGAMVTTSNPQSDHG